MERSKILDGNTCARPTFDVRTDGGSFYIIRIGRGPVRASLKLRTHRGPTF